MLRTQDLCMKKKICSKEIFTHLMCKILALTNQTIFEYKFYISYIVITIQYDYSLVTLQNYI